MDTIEPLKDIVIIYHQYCYDGFGAAWAAKKKLRETASCVPSIARDIYPEGIENKGVYIIDFCFTKEIMQELQKKNKTLVVIDHHISSKEIVESLPGHVFALEKSGAKLAWEYFIQM